MPHGHCYLWQPGTLWLNVISDGVIASAYYAIPFALYYLVRGRRAEIPYPGIFLMFAAFIFFCGTTHLMEIWTVWNPDYRLAGAIKALTGIVSVATMFALLQLMPQAMLLRSPRQLQQEVEARTAELARVNGELRAQIAARDLRSASCGNKINARTSSWRLWRMSCATRWRRSATPSSCSQVRPRAPSSSAGAAK